MSSGTAAGQGPVKPTAWRVLPAATVAPPAGPPIGQFKTAPNTPWIATETSQPNSGNVPTGFQHPAAILGLSTTPAGVIAASVTSAVPPMYTAVPRPLAIAMPPPTTVVQSRKPKRKQAAPAKGSTTAVAVPPQISTSKSVPTTMPAPTAPSTSGLSTPTTAAGRRGRNGRPLTMAPAWTPQFALPPPPPPMRRLMQVRMAPTFATTVSASPTTIESGGAATAPLVGSVVLAGPAVASTSAPAVSASVPATASGAPAAAAPAVERASRSTTTTLPLPPGVPVPKRKPISERRRKAATKTDVSAATDGGDTGSSAPVSPNSVSDPALTTAASAATVQPQSVAPLRVQLPPSATAARANSPARYAQPDESSATTPTSAHAADAGTRLAEPVVGQYTRKRRPPGSAATQRSRKPKAPLTAEQDAQVASLQFNGLTVGMHVKVCHCNNNARSDILNRRPELEGLTGVVTSIPIYPCTWVGVRLSTGEVIKLRSSNFEIVDEGDRTMPVQTDRHRRSLIFNSLGPGAKINILSHKHYTPPGGFPVLATVQDNTPVFPSTWISARVDANGTLLKVRTSQLTIVKEAPRDGKSEPSDLIKPVPPANNRLVDDKTVVSRAVQRASAAAATATVLAAAATSSPPAGHSSAAVFVADPPTSNAPPLPSQ